MGSFFNYMVYAEQALPVYIISLLEGSLKSSSLKTMVVSFLGQAIYVQLVDVDFESCRAAAQPGSSQGHFLCSTPYRVRLSRAADRAALAATVAAAQCKHVKEQTGGHCHDCVKTYCFSKSWVGDFISSCGDFRSLSLTIAYV